MRQYHVHKYGQLIDLARSTSTSLIMLTRATATQTQPMHASGYVQRTPHSLA